MQFNPALTAELDEIVAHLARYGVADSATQLRRLAAIAQTFGAQPAISGLLTDPATPDVVRERAAARVISALRNAPAAPTANCA